MFEKCQYYEILFLSVYCLCVSNRVWDSLLDEFASAFHPMLCNAFTRWIICWIILFGNCLFQGCGKRVVSLVFGKKLQNDKLKKSRSEEFHFGDTLMCKSKLNSLPDLCKSKLNPLPVLYKSKLNSLPDLCKSKLNSLPDMCKSK